MNEHIRELWLRSAIEDSGNNWDNQRQFIERFAKLIAKDCALIAGLMEHEGRTNIGAAILDKFGVEE